MSNKKGKKTKGVTMNLHEWQNDGNASVKTVTSWAEDVEDENDLGGFTLRKDIVLPSAPRSARDPDYNDESIPKHPPFVAYLSNLPYDLEEEDLHMFFEGLLIQSVKLPKDNNKPKGYGYVHFEDRASLVEAINKPDRTIRTRRIRIDVSNNTNDDRRNRMGMNRENRRDYNDDPERTAGDWRSGGRDEGPSDSSDRFRGRGGGGGGFDRDRRDDRGEGSDEIRQGAWREGERPKLSFRDSRDNRSNSDSDKDWNASKSRARSRDRDNNDRGSSFGPRRFGNDYNRGNDRGDDRGDRQERWGSNRNREAPDASAAAPAEQRTRPKLQLQPRTKPIEETAPPTDVKSESEVDGTSSATKAPAAPVPAANIFGAAKPVDTAAREREIEERLKRESESRSKEDEPEKRPAWNRRNGETRDEREKKPAWRSGNNEEKAGYSDKSGPRNVSSVNKSDHREPKDSKGDSRGTHHNSTNAPTRGSGRPTDSHAPTVTAEKEKKPKDEEEEIIKMPKAKDDETPNFIASNKYAMLPEDDPDNVEE